MNEEDEEVMVEDLSQPYSGEIVDAITTDFTGPYPDQFYDGCEVPTRWNRRGQKRLNGWTRVSVKEAETVATQRNPRRSDNALACDARNGGREFPAILCGYNALSKLTAGIQSCHPSPVFLVTKLPRKLANRRKKAT